MRTSICEAGTRPWALQNRNATAGLTRRSVIAGMGVAASFAVGSNGARAFSVLKGAGDIRSLKMQNGVTGESINTIYWIEGEYIKEALDEINHFMRDWRANKSFNMEVRNLDILSATHSLLETVEPFDLVSGYRTKATNDMLRRRRRNVAKNSLHMSGKAADIRLKNRTVRNIAEAAARCRSGGVGKYFSSNFVHVDCGQVRDWSA